MCYKHDGAIQEEEIQHNNKEVCIMMMQYHCIMLYLYIEHVSASIYSKHDDEIHHGYNRPGQEPLS